MSMSLEDRVATLGSVLARLADRLGETNDLLAALVTSPAATGISRPAATAVDRSILLADLKGMRPLPTGDEAPAAQDQGAQAPQAATPGAREAASPAASASRPPAPTPAPAAPAALQYDTDIGPRLVKIAQTKGREALVAFLSAFEVGKGADLPLDRYPEVVAKVDALLAEGA